MPHWLAATIAAATSVAAWRWIVRPLVRFSREALSLLRQIRTSASGVVSLTQEVRALAGSIVTLAAAMLTDQQELRAEHAWLREQHQELTGLVVDLDADVRRTERKVDANTTAILHLQHEK